MKFFEKSVSKILKRCYFSHNAVEGSLFVQGAPSVPSICLALISFWLTKVFYIYGLISGVLYPVFLMILV